MRSRNSGRDTTNFTQAERNHPMKRRSMPTPRSGREWLVGIGLAVGLILAAGGSARADDTTSPKFFKICNGTTPDGKTMVPHALCAVASCFVFNGLAYCKCDVAQGDSISLPFEFDDGQDHCGPVKQALSADKR